MAADRDRQLSFLGDAAPDPLALEDGRLTYAPAFFAPDVADRLLTELLASIEWHAESVHLFGKTHPVPRLVAWHGDAGTAYMYSGISHDPLPWTPALAAVRDQVAEAAGVAFNAVLLNRYRNGEDKMGWHADDEPELGPSPTIASISLGARRTFQLKHRTRRDLPRVDLELEHGSLLVMHPPTQTHWLHKVPRRARVQGERVNLTFRWIHAR